MLRRLTAFVLRAEPASVRLDPSAPAAAFLRACFASVLASLDERPRRILVDVCAGPSASIDFGNGQPLFRVGKGEAQADFRGRWLPEHPVPLALSPAGATRLLFVPTSGNRVKVRLVRV